MKNISERICIDRGSELEMCTRTCQKDAVYNLCKTKFTEWIPAKPSLGMNQSRLRKQLTIFVSIELGLN